MKILGQITALALLLALLIGVPAGLALTIGTPLDWTLPSLDSLRDTFTQEVSSTTIVHIVAGAAWVVWMYFVLCVAFELVNLALTKGWTMPTRGLRVPLSGGMQGFARRLVTAALLGAIATPLTVGAASAATFEGTTAPISASSYGQSLSLDVPGADASYTQTAAPEGSVGDVSWATGVSSVLPDAAAPAAAQVTDSTVDVATVQYTVAAPEGSTHDCLWDIAERHLGDPLRWKEIYDLNQDPAGVVINDPDLIQPGWTLTMPADAVGLPGSDAPAETPAPPAPAVEMPVEAPAPEPAEAPVPQDVPIPETVAEPAPAEASDLISSVQQAAEEHGISPWLVASCGIGGTLASGVLGALSLQRSRQRSRRAPGQRIALPEAAGLAVESQFRALNPAISISRVDESLCELARKLRAAKRPFPKLHGAYATSTHIDIFCAEVQEPVAPWTQDPDEPMHWRAELPAERTDGGPRRDDDDRPFPGLLTVGQSDAGGLLLLDVECVGSLGFTGPQPVAYAAQTAALVEILTSPWTADCHVTILAGDEPPIPVLEDDSRVRRSTDLDAEITRLEKHMQDIDRVLTSEGVATVGDLRSRNIAPDVWSPHILVIRGGHVTSEQHSKLLALTTRNPSHGIAIITAGVDPIGRWVVHFDDDTASFDPQAGECLSATFLPAGTTMWPQVMPPELLHHVAGVLAATHQPPTQGPAWTVDIAPTPGSATDLPLPGPTTTGVATFADEALPAPPHAGDAVSLPDGLLAPIGQQPLDGMPAPTTGPITVHSDTVRLRLLGPVDVEGAPGEEPRTAGQAHHEAVAELLAYIITAQEPPTAERACEALRGRSGPWTSRTLHSRLAQARLWLGEDDAGDWLVPVVGSNDPLTVSSTITNDWHDFTNQLGPTIGHKTPQELIEALRLVRGEPLGGEPNYAYSWAEALRLEMIQSITDAAHQCCTRALEQGLHSIAREAAAIGRLVDPRDDTMWQHSLAVEAADGTAQSLEHMAMAYNNTASLHDMRPSATTAHFLDQALSTPRM